MTKLDLVINFIGYKWQYLIRPPIVMVLLDNNGLFWWFYMTIVDPVLYCIHETTGPAAIFSWLYMRLLDQVLYCDVSKWDYWTSCRIAMVLYDQYGPGAIIWCFYLWILKQVPYYDGSIWEFMKRCHLWRFFLQKLEQEVFVEQPLTPPGSAKYWNRGPIV